MQLYGTGQYATQVDTLVELAAWHERNRNERQAYFDRIKAILAAWEDPAKKIADVLAANKAMIDGMEAMLASDQAGAIYTFFVKLLPAHWAIRPRTKGASKIPDNFIKICTCGNEDPDECCGPDTSEGSVLQRLTPALPYLVDPGALSTLLCCLVKERYLPAKELLAEAHAQYENAKANVERTTAQVKAKTDALEAAFKADLSGKIDCSKYWKKKNAEDPCTEPPTPPEPPKPDCPKPDTPTSDTPKSDTPKPDTPTPTGA
jgi:hypothetical protein